MKYIEQVKSVILLLLILLSLTLTFTIWTYSPSYDLNETPVVDIAIAEKKKLEDVVKPYRLMLSQESSLKGSDNTQITEDVLMWMKNWEIQTVELLNNQASDQQINDYIKTLNRITFFFPAEVPFKIYNNILTFSDYNLPNASFDRLIVEWSENASDKMNIYFISTTTKKVYMANIGQADQEDFIRRIKNQTMDLPVYNEIVRENRLSLYVSTSPQTMSSYSYIEEEIAPEKFKNALFTNPSLVRSNPLGVSGREYTDDSALMNVDYLSKRLSYVHPASESDKVGKTDELIQQSLNFINEHSGWTDDYRYSRINNSTKQVSYQLHFQGMPVFSKDPETEINLSWGTNRVYRYIRPYYAIADAQKGREIQLRSGQDIYNLIHALYENKVQSIDDIAIGYNLSRNGQQPLLNLEPSWYYLSNGSWTRVTPELLGGGKFGLE
ncbi:YycH family regulatory protein [Psychrobacillus sp. OK032]|uniref:YycH family regulatory protein n=1 Tax=Psychrobacillus sp. OK032 TaxID=1884358 RepID=UPI0015A612F0|nr:two-component system activity regulator YycH [Psychrobacillus sp. OK032]